MFVCVYVSVLLDVLHVKKRLDMKVSTFLFLYSFFFLGFWYHLITVKSEGGSNRINIKSDRIENGVNY